ncbi:hypothetical protein F0562_028462 [Nyssa sinensis]|uniref:RING-type domain-containing protein n=1 Tax=Nyssa sinensis TaxID=561372 RepID=A0A5J5B058_9ASTE|nr:hypothetical protein F0562_028462 [Nyssa sinensis]
MAIQPQLYSENLAFLLGGSQDAFGLNEFCFNASQKQEDIQQQQLQNCDLFPKINSKSHQSKAYSPSITAQIEKQRQEIDRFITLQNERLRLVLEEQRKQQLELLLEKYNAKTLILLKQKDEEIAKYVQRRMELEEFLRRMEIENQMWQRVAKEKEAMVLSLNNTIEQLRESACFNNGAEDAESCCDVMNRGSREDETGENRGHEEEKEEQRRRKMICKSCNSRNSCVIFLPCRHFCSCKACEACLDSCPVCGMTKKANLEVLI